MNKYPESVNAPRVPPESSPFAEMFSQIHTVALDDRLAVETFVSQLLGAVWLACDGVAEAEVRIGRECVDFLAGRADAESAAILAALSTLGTTESMRHSAQATLEVLSGSGVTAPRWHRSPMRLTECWRSGDVFGESTTVLCVAESGATRHGIVALVDNDCPPAGPVLSDVFITADPDEVVENLTEATRTGCLAVPPHRIPAAEAAAILTAGLAELDEGEPQGDAESALLRLRALIAARCRTVAGFVAVSAVPAAATVVDINRTLNGFLSAPEAEALPRTEEVVAAIELVAAFHLPGGLRVGPAVTQTFLHECVPAELDGDSELLPVLAEVLRAFNRWAGRQTGLPAAAIELLDQQTVTCAAHYREAIPDPGEDPPPPDWPGLFD